MVTMRDLLECGVHFGHQTRRWNPKMKKFIFGERKGIYIIDLQKTIRYFRYTYNVVRDAAAEGKTILFVGTKKQAGVAIKEYAEVTGKTLKYGVFAVLQSKLGDNDVFADDGTVADGVINAEITNYEFVAFELKITGFTDEQKDTKLAMGAYVAVTGGETTEYSYMQVGTPNANEKYCFISYNDIVN